MLIKYPLVTKLISAQVNSLAEEVDKCPPKGGYCLHTV